MFIRTPGMMHVPDAKAQKMHNPRSILKQHGYQMIYLANILYRIPPLSVAFENNPARKNNVFK
jgi:hypothetical protein